MSVRPVGWLIASLPSPAVPLGDGDPGDGLATGLAHPTRTTLRPRTVSQAPARCVEQIAVDLTVVGPLLRENPRKRSEPMPAMRRQPAFCGSPRACRPKPPSPPRQSPPTARLGTRLRHDRAHDRQQIPIAADGATRNTAGPDNPPSWPPDGRHSPSKSPPLERWTRPDDPSHPWRLLAARMFSTARRSSLDRRLGCSLDGPSILTSWHGPRESAVGTDTARRLDVGDGPSTSAVPLRIA